MANLDDIAAGKLPQTNQHSVSVHEAVIHLMLHDGIRKRQHMFERLSEFMPKQSDEEELHLIIKRTGQVGTIWSVFKTIENITDILEHIKSRLITVGGADDVTHHASEEDWEYWDYLKAAHDEARGTDDRAIVREGIVCYAAIKWYIVRVRELIGGVAENKLGVDWFWETFGEHHHMDLVKFRGQLVHMNRPEEYTPSKLSEQSDWFIEWLQSIARMGRRTSIAVPDATGQFSHSFRTAEISELPKTKGQETLSASNALVTITPELDPASSHPCKFGFVSFDPETNRLTAHDGQIISYAELRN